MSEEANMSIQPFNKKLESNSLLLITYLPQLDREIMDFCDICTQAIVYLKKLTLSLLLTSGIAYRSNTN